MKKLIQSVLLFAMTGLCTISANAQWSTYDRYEFDGMARGNNAEHRTHHFITAEQEFTILTDEYLVSKIDISGSAEFSHKYTSDDGVDFITIDIASVGDKILLLGYYKRTEGEDHTYTYSVISLNYDGTPYWEHIYQQEFDQLSESVNGEIMLAGITENGHYQLTEISTWDGSVLAYNSYDLDYLDPNSDRPSVPIIQLQAFELTENGYFAIGSAFTFARQAVSIYTEASSMTTTSKFQLLRTSHYSIMAIEPDGFGNFYFTGNYSNGNDILIGKIRTNHTVDWVKEYTFDTEKHNVYLNRSNHILQLSHNFHSTNDENRQLLTVAVRVTRREDSEVSHYNTMNTGVIQVDLVGNLMGKKYYDFGEPFSQESIHNSRTDQLLLFSQEWHPASDGSVVHRAGLTDFLENCQMVDFDVFVGDRESASNDVIVSPLEIIHDEAPKDPHPFQYQPLSYLTCDGHGKDRAKGASSLEIVDSKAIDFVIYPNPASSHVTITGDMEINLMQIFDALGREVMVNIQKINATTSTLNLSQLTPGTYTVLIQNETNTISKKLIVQ